jgi:quaternary ammonium compound-resistance protein SugE
MIPYLFALGIYGLGFGLYALALRRLDLSLAYPLMVGLSIVGVFLFATLSGTEAVSAPRICGAVLIMAGAFLVSK